MPSLMVDFIISLDGYAAADGWPGFWGLEGPEYLGWLEEQGEPASTAAERPVPGATHLDAPQAGNGVQDGSRLNVLHAGDSVTFAVSETAGTKTITKIDKK